MSQSHIDNHAAYVQHWIKAVSTDPIAIFSAAKGADLMVAYMAGLEKQMTAMELHREWIEKYDRPMQSKKMKEQGGNGNAEKLNQPRRQGEFRDYEMTAI